MTETILICEPSPEGIFSGVYYAYEKKLNPNTTHIQLGEAKNYRLFAEYMEVEADQEKAGKVERSLRKRLGAFTVESLWYALSSIHPERGDAAYHTIARGLAGAFRGELMDYLQDPYVNLISKLRIRVLHEVHHFMGFVRFAQLESGILYSEIKPKNHVLPFLGEHFADRFPEENFLIKDKERDLYLIHQSGEDYFLFKDQAEQVSGDSFSSGLGGGEKTDKSDREDKAAMPSLQYSREEEQIQQLFRCFVKNISIKEREKLKLQQQMLPLRFRSDMIEWN